MAEQTAESVKQEIVDLTAAIKEQRDNLQQLVEAEAEAASAAIAIKPAAAYVHLYVCASNALTDPPTTPSNHSIASILHTS
jgi:hypothetical protein